jgi:hypothetical protein
MGPESRRVKRAAGAVLFGILIAVPAQAQEPPDSIVVVDSLTALGSPSLVVDSLALDFLALAEVDTLVADSLSADTIFYNIPRGTGEAPVGFATGIWEWDRHSLMASGANTLAELFQEIPGLITLLGGDYGTPASISAFGLGGAGYRVFRDGFEVYPVDGGVADLQRIGLVAVSRIRLERSMGQMIIELTSYEYDDGRPFSVIEAGTGDLNTNMFRGIYADPTALGGSLGTGLERMDTRGRGQDRKEGGNRTGSWVRYQVHLQNRFGIGLDLRRSQSQTKVVEYTPTLTRTDVMVRAGLRVVDGVVVSGYAGRSSLSAETEASIHKIGGSRGQVSGSLAVDRGGFWLNGAYRQFEGDLPSRAADLSLGFARDRWGGLTGHVSQGTWNGTGTLNYGGRAWVNPIRGVTLFGSFSEGEFGSRDAMLMDGTVAPEAPDIGIVPGVAAITDRKTGRAGLSFSRWGVTLAGATLYTWSDLALPLGTEADYGAPADIGVHRTGFEAMAILPTRWQALTIEGSYQRWEKTGPYLPEQIYQGAFEYHKVFKETGNLELWFSAGVRGHDPMLTFVDDVGSGAGGVVEVPFYQSWYGHIQVRVVTVRLWLGMDNATLRQGNQTYPGRLLPYARSFFALRWDLWN